MTAWSYGKTQGHFTSTVVVLSVTYGRSVHQIGKAGSHPHCSGEPVHTLQPGVQVEQRYDLCMRSRGQEQAALRSRAFARLGVALVLLLILGFAGFRHSTRAMALTKESLSGVPAYVGGPANRPAVIVLQEW